MIRYLRECVAEVWSVVGHWERHREYPGVLNTRGGMTASDDRLSQVGVEDAPSGFKHLLHSLKQVVV